MNPDAEVSRALVVTAHPDDVDFGAGGTVATWTQAGIEVAYVVATDGDAGGFDPQTPRAQIPAIRQAEQRAAAAELGVQDVTFLGYPDGAVMVSLELRRDIARQIRRFCPQRVLCQSPRRNYARIGVSHPDHMATGEATLCAVYPDARNPFAFPELAAEGFAAWTVSEVWIAGDEEAETAVDVTETFPDKIRALRRHASQLTPGRDLEGTVRGWLAAAGARAGLPDDHLAEMFRVLPTA